MKPKGLQDRMADPYHGPKRAAVWLSVVVVSYGVVALLGFLAYAIVTYFRGVVG